MTTLPNQLSPERCHQLREGGIIRLWVNLLHEHTVEFQNKPEADINIETFLIGFNGKTELRNRLSQQLRNVVEHTAKNENELKILGMLEALRKYIEKLYHYITCWTAMTKDDATLSKFNYWFPDLAGNVNGFIGELEALTRDDAIRSIFEQFGGVFVIVDYLHAQTRFNARCHRFESDRIDSTQLVGVINDSKFALAGALGVLYNLVVLNDEEPEWSDDIILFLANSRSLHTIMVGIAENALNDGDLYFVEIYCCLLYHLYFTDALNIPTGMNLSRSHLKDCGVIKCLAKFGMAIKDPRTLHYVLRALKATLEFDRQNALEFASIDGAVDMLIDVLVPSEEKEEDAKWYKKQRHFSTKLLYIINGHLSPQDRLDGRLLAIYESRDFGDILVRYLDQITSFKETSQTIESVLELLKDIVVSSEDQRWKLRKIFNGRQVVKRFERFEDEYYVQLGKMICKLLE